MKKSWAIYIRELKSYFTSEIVYVIAAVFLIIIGNIFRETFFQFAARSMEVFRQAMQRGSDSTSLVNINSVALEIFNYINFILLLITPLLTMRLYAEERKNGTMELLITSPVTTVQVLMGKFLSCYTIYVLLTALTGLFMFLLALFAHGGLDLGPIFTSYVGTLLLGLAVIPVGMFFSSVTENQIVAAFSTLTTLLVLWILITMASRLFGYPLSDAIAYISLNDHLDFFKLGYFGIKHVVYYLSTSLFWLVLTWMSIESARWRQ